MKKKLSLTGIAVMVISFAAAGCGGTAPDLKRVNASAVDPMWLILSEEAYWVWVQKKHPDGPLEADIEEILRPMGAEELEVTLLRARKLSEYGHVVQAARPDVLPKLCSGGHYCQDLGCKPAGYKCF